MEADRGEQSEPGRMASGHATPVDPAPFAAAAPTTFAAGVRRAGTSAPAFVLGIALLLTAAATYYVSSATQAREHIRFAAEVHELRDTLSARFETYTSLLRGTTGLFAADRDVTLTDFHTYADRLDLARRYPGIRIIGYGLRVTPKDAASLVAKVRAEGAPSFHLWPLPQKDSPDGEQMPVLALEPHYSTYPHALGFDLLSETDRRVAIQRARDEGVSVATGRLIFLPGAEGQQMPGLIVFFPLYRGGDVPPNIPARRAAFAGVVYGGFRSEDLMQTVLAERDAGSRLSVRLYDGSIENPARLLYASPPPKVRPRLRSGDLRAVQHLVIAGRPWTLTCEPTAGFADETSDLTDLTLLSGLAISALLFWIALALERARDVAEATAERLRRSEETLREQETQQRAFFRDVLASVTEGRLRLCDSAADLPPYVPPSSEVTLEVKTLRDLRAAVREVCLDAGLPPERSHDLVTAVGEASMNAVVHAGGGRGSVAYLPGGVVQVRISDAGRGIDMQRLPRATLERGYTTAGTLGHGFFLILHSVDRIWLLTGPLGTTVVLEQEPRPDEPPWLTAKLGGRPVK